MIHNCWVQLNNRATVTMVTVTKVTAVCIMANLCRYKYRSCRHVRIVRLGHYPHGSVSQHLGVILCDGVKQKQIVVKGDFAGCV